MTKLSIILCGRNDNYGGSFLTRLTNSLNWNSQLAQKHQISIELIFVEYNPPIDQPKLVNLEIWPDSFYWQTKVIEFNDGTSVFDEFKAKNIGLAKIGHGWTLITNADIFLPEWLFQNLSALNQNNFYLANRLNSEPNESWKKMIGSANEYCVMGGIFYRSQLIPHKLFFPLLKRYLPIRRWIYETFPFLLESGATFLLKYPFAGCGDFMLTGYENWKALGGYKENTIASLHVDSLFLLKVIDQNIRIDTLPEPVIHQNHTHRYSFKNPTKEMNIMWAQLLESILEMKKVRLLIVEKSK